MLIRGAEREGSVLPLYWGWSRLFPSFRDIGRPTGLTMLGVTLLSVKNMTHCQPWNQIRPHFHIQTP